MKISPFVLLVAGTLIAAPCSLIQINKDVGMQVCGDAPGVGAYFKIIPFSKAEWAAMHQVDTTVVVMDTSGRKN